MYELKSVSKSYGGGRVAVQALKDIHLRIEDGEFVGIVGPSGSGKSTLMQMLGALDAPTSGSVLFEGSDLATLRDAELTALRRDAMGFIFQQFNLIPTLTALDNVEVALVPTALNADERRRRSRAALESVRLADRLEHLPGQLSGGEQQRVAIARALVTQPRVLLADEPTGNLDSATGAEVMRLLRTLNTEHGHSVVLVTHDAGVAGQMARVVELGDGRVLRTNAPS